MDIEKYTLEYENIDYFETESKEVATAALSVYNQGEFIGVLTPEKYFHRSYDQGVTEVAIRSTLSEDLYVILLGWDGEGAATFKVLVNPLVNWMWIGGIVFVIGSLISFWPERRRPSSSDRTERRKE